MKKFFGKHLNYGVDINHMRAKDFHYLRTKGFEIERNKNNNNGNLFKQINYFKRVYWLQYIFEIEETLCFFFEKRLNDISKLKLSQLNTKAIEGYVSKNKLQPFIQIFNKWFNDKNRNFKTKHQHRNSINLSTIYDKLGFGQKILILKYLNGKGKAMTFNCHMSNGKKRINNLEILRKIRNHLSHEYWAIDNEWVKSILFNPDNKWKEQPSKFFDRLDKEYHITHNGFLYDSHKWTKKSVSFKAKKILKKYENNIFFIL